MAEMSEDRGKGMITGQKEVKRVAAFIETISFPLMTIHQSS